MLIWGDFLYLLRKPTKTGSDRPVLVDLSPTAIHSLLPLALAGQPYEEPNVGWVRLRLIIISVRPYPEGEETGAIIEAYKPGSKLQKADRVSILCTRFDGSEVWIDEKADVIVRGDENKSWGIGRAMMSHSIRWASHYHPQAPVKKLFPTPARASDIKRFYRLFGFTFAERATHADPATPNRLCEFISPGALVEMSAAEKILSDLMSASTIQANRLSTNDPVTEEKRTDFWKKLWSLWRS